MNVPLKGEKDCRVASSDKLLYGCSSVELKGYIIWWTDVPNQERVRLCEYNEVELYIVLRAL